jgi:hypothetical protein
MTTKRKSKSKIGIPSARIENRILVIRGHKVMLDIDLAELYDVEAGQLNRAVKRNLDRFPPDFMFQLNVAEYESLRSQFGISRWGGRRYRPYAFSEQGVAMLSTVLKSKRAIEVNIQIMRTFVKLRGMISSHRDLARKLAELERRYDDQFSEVFEAIKELMQPTLVEKTHRIGFIHGKDADDK